MKKPVSPKTELRRARKVFHNAQAGMRSAQRTLDYAHDRLVRAFKVVEDNEKKK